MNEKAFSRTLDRFTSKYLANPQRFSALASRAVKKKPTMVGFENIVGTAIEEKIARGKPTGELCLKVYVKKKFDQNKISSQSMIPYKFDRIITDVEQTGEIIALLDRRCYSPVRPGCSIGHVRITAGTLGCLVKRPRRQQFILSNNHVIARVNLARLRDNIVQPGRVDGGRHNRRNHPQSSCRAGDKCIATLNRFVRINFRGNNRIDAAIGKPIRSAYYRRGRRINSRIISIGSVSGTTIARRGMSVKKRGRTTGFTTGRITSVNTNINVGYGGGRVARFIGQLTIMSSGRVRRRFSAGGDSGSLIVTTYRRMRKNRGVGLLFAGSRDGRRTFANHIGLVLRAFRVTIVP